MSYNSWTEYTPLTGNSAKLDSVVTVNPVYLGAIGKAFGSQIALQAYLTAAAWNTIITNLYQGDANPALTVMRLMVFPAYYQAVGAAVNQSGSTLRAQWASATNNNLLSANAAALAGFELSPYATALSQSYISANQAAIVLDVTATSSVSLLSSPGLANWLAALSAPTSSSGIAAATTLITALTAQMSGQSATGTQAFQQIALYLADKLNANSTSSAAYLGVCRSALFVGAGITLPASSSVEYPTTWSDLGLYQFGQGAYHHLPQCDPTGLCVPSFPSTTPCVFRVHRQASLRALSPAVSSRPLRDLACPASPTAQSGTFTAHRARRSRRSRP